MDKQLDPMVDQALADVLDALAYHLAYSYEELRRSAYDYAHAMGDGPDYAALAAQHEQTPEQYGEANIAAYNAKFRQDLAKLDIRTATALANALNIKSEAAAQQRRADGAEPEGLDSTQL